VPVQLDDYGAFAGVDIRQGRRQPTIKFDLDAAKQIDGRWTFTATVPLQTSRAQKYFRAYFNKDNDAFFTLPLRSRPNRSDLTWSSWVESGWNANRPEPVAEEKFNLRYRVQVVEPPPPGPTEEENAARLAAEEQARFEALGPDTTIAEWLPFIGYGASDERREIAVRHMRARASFVSELSALMHSADAEVASEALRLVEHISSPPPEIIPPVVDVGRELAALIRTFNASTPEKDPSYLGAAEISVRFSGWMVAVRSLRQTSGGDFTPELREILELARVRPDSHAMRGDVLRVASYYMHEWTGLAPLPTDPKPN